MKVCLTHASSSDLICFTGAGIEQQEAKQKEESEPPIQEEKARPEAQESIAADEVQGVPHARLELRSNLLHRCRHRTAGGQAEGGV